MGDLLLLVQLFSSPFCVFDVMLKTEDIDVKKN